MLSLVCFCFLIAFGIGQLIVESVCKSVNRVNHSVLFSQFSSSERDSDCAKSVVQSRCNQSVKRSAIAE